jgi:ATP-binding protein involved in chromosome partitioning
VSDDSKRLEVLKTHAKVPYGHSAHPNDRAAFAKQVVIVTSGKGGVGKSTVAVNLANALAQGGLAVGLLDADVYGPSVPRMLSLEGERLSWNDADRIACAENFGLKVMSVGMTTPTADTPLIWRASVATSAMVQLLEDVDWGPLDVLVIDMPPGTGDTQLTMAQEVRVSAAVVVTTPQKVATDDVRRAIRMLEAVHIPIAGVVETMGGEVFGRGGGRALCDAYGLELLAEVPLDPAIREASDDGKPIAAVGTEAQRRVWLELAAKLRARLLALAPEGKSPAAP